MPTKHFRSVVLVLLTTAAFVLAACGGDGSDEAAPPASTTTATTAPAPDRVTFMAGFKPQANLPFVGVYVAQEKGFFAEQNLEVEIQHVTTPGDNFPLLASGKIQFSTADATSVLERWASDPPLPVVSIALIGQTGQQGFATLRSNTEIETPADWAGKTVGYKGASVTPDYLAILEANGVDRSTITEVKVGFEPQVLTEGAVDVYPVFLSNEPDTLRRLGYETRLFAAADYGAPTLGLTYVAMEDYIAQNPDVVRRFLRAVLDGILYADDHRDEAVQIVMKYAPEEDPEHQRYMLDVELDMARRGLEPLDHIGDQTVQQWQALYDYLMKYNALPGPIDDITRVFTVDFQTQGPEG